MQCGPPKLWININNHLINGDVQLSGPLGLFNKSRLMSAPSISFTSYLYTLHKNNVFLPIFRHRLAMWLSEVLKKNNPLSDGDEQPGVPLVLINNDRLMSEQSIFYFFEKFTSYPRVTSGIVPIPRVLEQSIFFFFHLSLIYYITIVFSYLQLHIPLQCGPPKLWRKNIPMSNGDVQPGFQPSAFNKSRLMSAPNVFFTLQLSLINHSTIQNCSLTYSLALRNLRLNSRLYLQ